MVWGQEIFLGGGFKHSYFHPYFGKDSHFDSYFSFENFETTNQFYSDKKWLTFKLLEIFRGLSQYLKVIPKDAEDSTQPGYGLNFWRFTN